MSAGVIESRPAGGYRSYLGEHRRCRQIVRDRERGAGDLWRSVPLSLPCPLHPRERERALWTWSLACGEDHVGALRITGRRYVLQSCRLCRQTPLL